MSKTHLVVFHLLVIFVWLCLFFVVVSSLCMGVLSVADDGRKGWKFRLLLGINIWSHCTPFQLHLHFSFENQYILSPFKWSILSMIHMRALKWKARTEVRNSIHSGNYSWSCLIVYMEHWQTDEIWVNAVEMHCHFDQIALYLMPATFSWVLRDNEDAFVNDWSL